ncbi:MAG: disulfide bond formation protein B [Alphaproteobacteria bacterium]
MDRLSSIKSSPPRMTLLAASILLIVYIAEYGFGILPCQLCLWQRVPWWIMLVISILFWLLHPRLPRHYFTLIALIIMLGSAGLGLFHVGVEYGWWAGLSSCGGSAATAANDGPVSLVERMRQAQATQIVPCDQPAWQLFGISFAGYNLIASFLLIVYLIKDIISDKASHAVTG